MADVADMLLQQGFKNASEVPDVAGAMTKGAQLAESINQIQLSRAQFEQQKQQQYVAKIEKFSSLYETAAKLPPGSARNNLYKTVIPKTRDALGLQAEFPDDSLQMINSAPEVIGYLKAKVEAGDMTLPQLLQNMQDPQWIADNIPAAIQEKAGQDLTPQVTDNMQALSDAEKFRLTERNNREQSMIQAGLQADRAAADDARSGQKKLSEEVAKQYAQYASGGGKAGIKSALGNLTEAAEALDKGTIQTGGVSTKIPGFKSDDAQSMINPEMIAMKAKAQGALNTVLRATLGAQFTEGEGQRVLNQVWDDRQPPKVNAQKIRSKISELRENVKGAEAEFKRFGFLKEEGIANWKPKVSGLKSKAQQLPKEEQKKFLDALSNKLNVPVGELRKELGI